MGYMVYVKTAAGGTRYEQWDRKTYPTKEAALRKFHSDVSNFKTPSLKREVKTWQPEARSVPTRSRGGFGSFSRFRVGGLGMLR